MALEIHKGAIAVNPGLDDVIVGTTRMSLVDGENGRLYYCGYAIGDLAAHSTFEEVVFLLWNNRLPNASELQSLQADLARELPVPQEIINSLKMLPKTAHPMGALRTAVSMLGNFDPEEGDNSPEANTRKALRLVAKTFTVTAAWARIRNGHEVVTPRQDLSLAANLLYMMFDQEPNEDAVRAIDAYLILLSEHGFNASTFTGRVVTSTDADMYSAIVAAIGALKGPKHGGANEAAMKIFLEIGDPDNVENWFKTEVKGEKKRRISGFGHRVYKSIDPRAAVLKVRAEAAAHSSGNEKWYAIASKLDDLARSDASFIDKKLYANVDYYGAIVLYTLNIPVDFFTPLFAVSRVPGWCAHIIEQWASGNQLIRPDVEYTGPVDLKWVPLSERA